MITEQFHKIESIFHHARNLEPADRATYLDEACAGDLDLRAEVESLLVHMENKTEQLEVTPSGEGFRSVLVERDDGDTAGRIPFVERGPGPEKPGTRIGPYKILQEIGEGGFGSVYMAEQDQPIQRKVALKIIKLGMDTKQVIARFEAERQALAMMDHTNIARVFEAGATETGRPYFVMELVKGIPINEYCDRNKLSTRKRLELFVEVCLAVQHAHQKGVIHRDLKPSNVLVTLHDTRPVPKVIDFGIAKATSGRLTDRTLFTEFRQFIGTPEYMSPDQAEISALDVDTRTDIFTLGVMLYELLTGTTPLDPLTLRKAASGEVQRMIREVDPPRPSTRVETLERQGANVSQRCASEPGALSRIVRGDLDWIVMKAMEKDRTRRYQSVSELAADVERHLRHEPVIAGPPSVVYKCRKFVRRHQLGVMAGLFVTAALVVGFSAAAVGFFQARQEAHRSQTIADFLQDLFVTTNPEQAIARDADVEGVLATARDVFGDDHATVAATLSSRALQLQSSGNLEAAEEHYRRSIEIWREQHGDENMNIAGTLRSLGLLQMTKGDDAAAEGTYREALRIMQALQEDESLVTAETMSLLAAALANRGENEEAVALLRESVRIRTAVAPHQRLQIALTWNSLANTLIMSGREDDATEAVTECLGAWRAALPEDSLFLARVITEIGAWELRIRNRPDEAEALFREAIGIFRKADEKPVRHFTGAVLALHGILEDREDPVTLLPLDVEAVEVSGRLENSPYGEEAIEMLSGHTWRIALDADRSEADYRAALDALLRLLAIVPDRYASINTLGVLHYRLGEHEEALTALAVSHEHYSTEYEGGVPADLAFMALAHHALGHEEQAQALLLALRIAMRNPEFAQRESNRANLAEAEVGLGQPAAARPTAPRP